MATRANPNPPDLDFEQIEMLANFSDYAADCPDLSFEEIPQMLGVDFRKANNGIAWQEECRAVFERERGM